MQMSFSHAWHLVEDMSALSPEPLVEKRTGGRQGGGSWLTDIGQQAVYDFRQLMARFQEWIERETF
jgi:molybdate transport system regulatory protein